MPHKRNPILAERVTGLARLLRADAMVGLENMALWHERDISHSSAERFVFERALGVAAYATRTLADILDGLEIDADRMLRNLDELGGMVYSEALLLAMVARGADRQAAYRLVQARRQTGVERRDDVRRGPPRGPCGRCVALPGRDPARDGPAPPSRRHRGHLPGARPRRLGLGGRPSMRRWREAAAASARVVSERPELWVAGGLAWAATFGTVALFLAVVPAPNVSDLTFFAARTFVAAWWPWNALGVGAIAAFAVLLALWLVSLADVAVLGERRGAPPGSTWRAFAVTILAALPVLAVAGVTALVWPGSRRPSSPRRTRRTADPSSVPSSASARSSASFSQRGWSVGPTRPPRAS